MGVESMSMNMLSVAHTIPALLFAPQISPSRKALHDAATTFWI